MLITKVGVGVLFTDTPPGEYAALSAANQRRLPKWRLRKVHEVTCLSPGRIHVDVENGQHETRLWCIPALAEVTVLNQAVGLSAPARAA